MDKKKFNVMRWDFNSDKLVPYDVLPYLREEVKERWERIIKDKNKTTGTLTVDKLKELVEGASRYRFWARCEYEMICHGWPVHKNEHKLDIHEQIMMNIDVIVDILWNEFCHTWSAKDGTD